MFQPFPPCEVVEDVIVLSSARGVGFCFVTFHFPHLRKWEVVGACGSVSTVLLVVAVVVEVGSCCLVCVVVELGFVAEVDEGKVTVLLIGSLVAPVVIVVGVLVGWRLSVCVSVHTRFLPLLNGCTVCVVSVMRSRVKWCRLCSRE